MADNLFTEVPDRVAHIKNYLKLEELVMPIEEVFGDKNTFKTPKEGLEFYVGVLEEMGRVAAKEVKPKAEEIDRNGVHLKNGKVEYPEALTSHLKKFKELGVFGGNITRKYGGFNLPKSVSAIALEMMGHACPNTGLTVAAFCMGDWVERWGTEKQKDDLLPKIAANEITTSMALTEAGAGSDLGKMRTSAKQDGDRWLINGTKQFITNGDSALSFALVRTDTAKKGLEGLSVLLVRDKRKDGSPNVRVTKIEDKICLHSSPTCELVYENTEAEMFGPEGQGFKVMLDLMNAARLGMSILALGICQNALDEAKAYAKERVTMGKPIFQHPMVADLLFEMELEIRAMRAMCMEASRAADWMAIYETKGDKVNYKRWQLRYRRLTPLCKYMCAEKCVTITKNALQIFGGYGVCKDYPMERLFRESIIFPIYEGTSQIQSLMVLKDTMKDVAMKSTGFMGSLAGAWAESKVTLDPVKAALLQARNELNQGIRTILVNIIKDKFKSDIEAIKEKKIQDFLKEFSLKLLSEKTDLTYPFLVAERFTRITADYYALKCLADQLPPGDKERRKWVLDYAELVLPRMRMENYYMVNRLPSTLDYLERMK